MNVNIIEIKTIVHLEVNILCSNIKVPFVRESCTCTADILLLWILSLYVGGGLLWQFFFGGVLWLTLPFAVTSSLQESRVVQGPCVEPRWYVPTCCPSGVPQFQWFSMVLVLPVCARCPRHLFSLSIHYFIVGNEHCSYLFFIITGCVLCYLLFYRDADIFLLQCPFVIHE